MKYALLILLLSACSTQFGQKETPATDVVVVNSTDKDSVKVYLTLQSTEDVRGMFGIKDTSVAKCKGWWWAKKGVKYHINTIRPLNGAIITFGGDNQSCTAAQANGFPNGLNNFEFSVNVPFEAWDISCVDGANSVIRVDPPVTFGQATENKLPLSANVNIPGVFPYGCTTCQEATNPPALCFGKPTCSTTTQCQFNRSGNGGEIVVSVTKI